MASDIAAANAALQEFEQEGGVTLDELKAELFEPASYVRDDGTRMVRVAPFRYVNEARAKES